MSRLSDDLIVNVLAFDAEEARAGGSSAEPRGADALRFEARLNASKRS